MYSVIWTEKNCGYHNFEETGCIWDEYLFMVDPEDMSVEIRPLGEKGKRVTHTKEL